MSKIKRALSVFFTAAFLAAPAIAELPESPADILAIGAELSGTNVRPEPRTGSATGHAMISVLKQERWVGYRIAVASTANPAVAHIHRGTPDQPGEIVVDLKANFLRNSQEETAIGWAEVSLEIAEELHSNPAAFYVDTHSTNEVSSRGQLRPLQATKVAVPALPMTGPDADASGTAIFSTFNLVDTLHYSISTEGITNPTAAHIHYGAAGESGRIAVDLKPSFTGGTAVGSVPIDVLLSGDIHRSPDAFYVDVHSAEHPNGAIRAQIGRPLELTSVVIPVVGKAAGANDTFFRTDLSIVNESESINPVFIHYYASGDTARPVRTISRILAPHEQRTFKGDELQTALGAGDGTGAIRIEAPRPMSAVARIYNDQRSQGKGTFAQFVHAQTVDERRVSGTLPMLANQQGGSGFRTNIGWFNSTRLSSNVTFKVHRENGAVLQTVTRTVPPLQQLQTPLSQLFPNLEPLDSLYVTFSATSLLHVYASVVDNTNGDAVFIPAQAR